MLDADSDIDEKKNNEIIPENNLINVLKSNNKNNQKYAVRIA